MRVALRRNLEYTTQNDFDFAQFRIGDSMDWLRLLRLRSPKTPTELAAETDVEHIITWCRQCHKDHPVIWSDMSGVLTSFPAWSAIPPFLALKKIGLNQDTPPVIMDPLISALSADATETLAGQLASHPDMNEIYEAIIPNMKFWTRLWLTTFSKVKRGYFNDKDAIEAMLTAFFRGPGAELRDKFHIEQDEDEKIAVKVFGSFMYGCNRELYNLKPQKNQTP